MIPPLRKVAFRCSGLRHKIDCLALAGGEVEPVFRSTIAFRRYVDGLRETICTDFERPVAVGFTEIQIQIGGMQRLFPAEREIEGVGNDEPGCDITKPGDRDIMGWRAETIGIGRIEKAPNKSVAAIIWLCRGEIVSGRLVCTTGCMPSRRQVSSSMASKPLPVSLMRWMSSPLVPSSERLSWMGRNALFSACQTDLGRPVASMIPSQRRERDPAGSRPAHPGKRNRCAAIRRRSFP